MRPFDWLCSALEPAAVHHAKFAVFNVPPQTNARALSSRTSAHIFFPSPLIHFLILQPLHIVRSLLASSLSYRFFPPRSSLASDTRSYSAQSLASRKLELYIRFRGNGLSTRTRCQHPISPSQHRVIQETALQVNSKRNPSTYILF